MIIDLPSVIARVKAGVKFLDKKIPNWRTIIKRHQDEFNFCDGDYCVLGTLEQYSGRMRVLKAKQEDNDRLNIYGRALTALGFDRDSTDDEDHGFDVREDINDDETEAEEYAALDALWRAEIGI